MRGTSMSLCGAWGRGIAALAVLAGAGALPGCCCVPRAERYFDRQDPFETVNGFVYAIDAGQYRFAYDCLTEESRKLFTFTKFKLALQFNFKVPELEIPIRDLILGAERYRYRASKASSRQAEVILQYRLPDGNPLRPVLYLERETDEAAAAAGREDPLWRIDLDRSLRDLTGVDLSGLAGPVE